MKEAECIKSQLDAKNLENAGVQNNSNSYGCTIQ